MLFINNDQIDQAWALIAQAVMHSDILGPSAKVSRAESGNPTHVICVYAASCEKSDVDHVLKGLRQLGFTSVCCC